MYILKLNKELFKIKIDEELKKDLQDFLEGFYEDAYDDGENGYANEINSATKLGLDDLEYIILNNNYKKV